MRMLAKVLDFHALVDHPSPTDCPFSFNIVLRGGWYGVPTRLASIDDLNRCRLKISYLVVRAFEVVDPSCNLFRLTHSAQAKTRAETFMYIPSTQFLCRIQDESNLDGSGNVTLSERVWSVFQKLAGDPTRRETLAASMRSLNAASKKNGKQRCPSNSDPIVDRYTSRGRITTKRRRTR